MPIHTNALIHCTSPYLRQHAHNPVDWLPWGEEAFSKARERDCPILLSVGYSSCHWCHVMERESFENEAIADLMNTHFVPVKVDREERPDVDHLYMSAVQIMTGQGGWPMTMFLTPEGKPFYGGTYYPPDDRYGRPGFPRVLQAVHDAWLNRKEDVVAQGQAMQEQIAQSMTLAPTEGELNPGMLDRCVAAMRRGYDEEHGGFGDAPKFPPPMVLDFLLQRVGKSNPDPALEMVVGTLDGMARGGLRDHVGGGFHRYSVDAYWLVPHFEKMLYDNAQLAVAYLQAWQVTGNESYRSVCEETLDFVRREMTSPLGGFYSALDADSDDGEGNSEEGAFYVWRPKQVKEALGEEDGALFCRVYDITPRGNFEGKNIPNLGVRLENVAESLGIELTELQSRLTGMKMRLHEARDLRPRPFRDEKVVTAWNGLMLSAFAQAGGVFGRADYLQTARNNATFLLRELTSTEGRLLRTGIEAVPDPNERPEYRESVFRSSPIHGFLEDYANLAQGLLDLYQATFEPEWLNESVRLANEMISQFDDGAGGFFDAEASAEDLFTRPRDTSDNATPCGNSSACLLLLQLGTLMGRQDYTLRARGWLSRMAGHIPRYPSAFGKLLQAASLLMDEAPSVVIAGDAEDPRTDALAKSARAAFRAGGALALAAPGNHETPLTAGRAPVNGVPAAYVCRGGVCSLPLCDPGALADQLKHP